MRRAPARLLLGTAIAAQLVWAAPHRAALWRDVARHARAADDDARRRIAWAPASYDLLEEVRRRTAPSSRILLVTTGERGAGDPDDVLYHRALVHLYPRAVRWVKPAEPRGHPVWWHRADLERSRLLAEARAFRATTIVAVGFRPKELPSLRLESGALLVHVPEAR